MDNQIKTAGYMLRLIAKLIDILIYSIPMLLVVKYFSVVTTFSSLVNTAIVLLIILFLTNILIWIYNIVLTFKFGGTIGKLIVGLRVVDENGAFITMNRAFFRHVVGYFISNIFFGLGYFWIIKDKENQGWHDQISNTYVIKKNVSEGSIGLSIVLVLFLLVFYSTVFYNVYMSMTKNAQFIFSDLSLQMQNIDYQIQNADIPK